jgi:hypothetical protein
MRALAAAAAAAACAASVRAAPWVPFPDSTLNVTQIVASQPESNRVYLGSPTIVRLPSGAILTAHDKFGSGLTHPQSMYAVSSSDEGATWTPVGTVSPMYWGTLFTRPLDNGTTVYIIGTTNDGSLPPAQIAISSSSDGGQTWRTSVPLSNSTINYSCGPTPVLLHAGRIWRAFEHNVGPGWASGYSTLVVSAALDAPDLLDPSAWTLSGELPFSAVASLVPANWSDALVTSGFGWLETNAVEPVDLTDTGVMLMLRVNSLPAANKAALLHVATPTAAPTFVAWVDPFPGGMSKFTVRRDPVTKVYLTLSNQVNDASVTLPPSCGPVSAPAGKVGCCGFLETCFTTSPTCLWCHAVSRNNLTLSVSVDLHAWTVVKTVLYDDTGVPAYMSELGTGFQYVDFQVEGDTIIFAARAGYRGSNNYHNANRHLFGTVQGWRETVEERAPGLLGGRN